MKKIIYVVLICWVFILWIIIENISFVYAQTDLLDAPTDTPEYGIIRIKDPNNTWKWITILDRNLWATTTWAWIDESRESFWYYYQWWNNYGFPSDLNATIISGNTKVDASGYWPNTANGYYSSNTFIKWDNDRSSPPNDNLRWWANDNQSNNRWLDLNNPKDRQGPCPENYHVPSIWEWSKLLEFRAEEYGNMYLSSDNGLYKFAYGNHDAADEFYNRFFIPIAGWRDNNTNTRDTDDLLLFWSSSPTNTSDAFRLYWNSTTINGQYINKRAYAFPIRCFFDSYRLPVKITYDVNWWYWINEGNKVLQKVITYTRDDDSEYSWDIELWKVKKDDCWDEDKMCMFGWWYTLTGDELWTGNISEDITLYAKWLAYDDKHISLSGINFKIMDRNLWAEIPWTGEDAYGYYLTWWEGDILCPEWYHIPNTWERMWIKNLLTGDFSSVLIQDLLNLPFAGMIQNDVAVDWKNGYYSAKNGNEIMYAKISDSSIEIENLNEWEKVLTRCFKDNSKWTIKFHSEWWNNIADIETVNWREEWEDLQKPKRNNSTFLWWFDQNDIQIEKNINYKNEEEINLYAKWKCKEWYQENGNKCEEISEQSGWNGGWSSGWSGRWNGKDSIIQSWADWSERSTIWETSIIPANSSTESMEWQNNKIKNLGDMEEIDSLSKTLEWEWDFPKEFIDAYNFAYKNWITTKTSIYEAKMYSPLTRIQMAKMLSKYAINVLWKKPDVSKWMKKFDDVSNKLDKEYGDAITLTYQLWIMWQNIKNNKFRPNNVVTRAEFATALSRLLYWTEDWKNKYYEPHITKLYDEWIINNINQNLIEKRWYVMIVLMRTSN